MTRQRATLLAAVALAFVAGLLVGLSTARAAEPAPRSTPEADGVLPTWSGAPSSTAVAPSMHTSESGAKRRVPRSDAQPTAQPSAAPSTKARRDVVTGTASTYGKGWDGWIAWPAGPGWRLRVCGDGGCRTVTSNDAGPDRAMQRAGRVIDLDIPTFEAVCGIPWWPRGLCTVTVTVLGRG